MNQKLSSHIKESFTNNEILRIFDLCKRRMVDNGRSSYTYEENEILNKISNTWGIFGKGSMC